MTTTDTTRTIAAVQRDMRRARAERNEEWYRRLWQEKRALLVEQAGTRTRTRTNGQGIKDTVC